MLGVLGVLAVQGMLLLGVGGWLRRGDDGALLALLGGGSARAAGVSVWVSDGGMLRNPRGIVFDSLGNAFVAAQGTDAVTKVTAAGEVSEYATGLQNPWGVALDGAGNLYVTLVTKKELWKISPDGSRTLVASGLKNMHHLVFNPSDGLLYVTREDGVSTVNPATGAVNALWETPYPNGTDNCWGIALDTADGFYVAMKLSRNEWLFHATPNGQGGLNTATVETDGNKIPRSLAVDALGNLYAGDNKKQLWLYPGGQGPGQLLSENELKQPFGLAVHPLNGDLYVTESTMERIAIWDLSFDGSGPVVSVTAPAGGALTSDNTPAVAVSYNDADSGVKTRALNVQVDGADVTGQLTIAAGEATGALGAPLADGPHTLTARIENLFGVPTVMTSLFTVDATAPVLLVSDPSGDATVSAPVLVVNGSVSDAGSVVSVAVNGQNAVLAGGAFTANMNLNEGANVLTFVATDGAGNSATATRIITYNPPDVTPPVVVLSTPTPGQILATNMVSIAATATDDRGVNADSVTLTLDGAAVSVTANLPSLTATASDLSDGPHTLTLNAQDSAGNAAAPATVTFTTDNTAPVLSVTQPATDETVMVNTATLAGAASDAVGPVTVTLNGVAIPLNIDPNQQPSGLQSPASSLFSQTLTLAEGANVYALTATDSAGHSSTVVRTITFAPPPPGEENPPPTPDTTAPSLTLTSHPMDAVVSEASVVLMGVAADDVALGNLTINGQSVALTGGNFSHAVTLAPGANVLTLLLTDAAGNTTPLVRTLTYTPPAPPVEAPVLVVENPPIAEPPVPPGVVENPPSVEPPVVQPPPVETPVAENPPAAELPTETPVPVVEAPPPVEAPAPVVENPPASEPSAETPAPVAENPPPVEPPVVVAENPPPTAMPPPTPVADTTPPVILLTSPASDTFTTTEATLALTGLVSDDTGPVNLMVNGVTLVASPALPNSNINPNQQPSSLQPPASSLPFNNVLTLAPGSNVFVLVATDQSGNVATATLNITRQTPVDTTPPALTITAPPRDPFWLNTLSYVLEGQTEAGATVSVDETPAVVTPDGRFVMPVSLTEGNNAILVMAQKGAAAGGRSARAAAPETTVLVELVADTLAPEITWLNPDVSSNLDGQSPVRVNVQEPVGSTGSGVNAQSLTLTVDGQNVLLTAAGAGGEFTAPLPLLADSAHTFVLTAQDNAGNLATSVVTVTGGQVQVVSGGDFQTQVLVAVQAMAATSTIPLNLKPLLGVAVTHDDKVLAVTEKQDQVVRVDPTTGSILATYAGFPNLYGVGEAKTLAGAWAVWLGTKIANPAYLAQVNPPGPTIFYGASATQMAVDDVDTPTRLFTASTSGGSAYVFEVDLATGNNRPWYQHSGAGQSVAGIAWQRDFAGKALYAAVDTNPGAALYRLEEQPQPVPNFDPNPPVTVTLLDDFGGKRVEPRAVAVDAEGNVYLADSTRNQLWILPGGQGPVAPVFSGQVNRPMGMAVSRDGRTLYLSERGSGNLKVLALPTDLTGPEVVLNNPTEETATVSVPVTVDIAWNDPESGIGDLGLVEVRLDGRNITGNLAVSATGVTGTLSNLSLGPHTLTLVVYNGDGIPQTLRLTLQVQSPPAQPVDVVGRLRGLTQDGQGNLYVAHFSHQRILKVDTSGTAFVTTPLFTGAVADPWGVAHDAGANALFVGSPGNDAVYRISLPGGPAALLASVPQPRQLALDVAHNALLVASSQNNGPDLYQIDLGTNQVTALYDSGDRFKKGQGVVLGPGGEIYLSLQRRRGGQRTSEVMRLTRSGGGVVGGNLFTFTGQSELGDLAWHPDGFVYAAEQNGNFMWAVWDSGQPSTALFSGQVADPFGLVFVPSLGGLFATERQGGRIVKLAGSSETPCAGCAGELMAIYGDRNITLVKNHGDGSVERLPVTLNTAGAGMTAVFTGDLDNDGDADVLAADSSPDNTLAYGDRVSLFLNQGNDTFSAFTPVNTMPLRFRLHADSHTCAADFNNDGRLDVVFTGMDESPGTTSGAGGSTLLLSAATGPPVFTIQEIADASMGQEARAGVVCEDVVNASGNRGADGRVDLIVATSSPVFGAYLFPNTGTSAAPVFGTNFGQYVALPAPSAPQVPVRRSLVLLDVDADGLKDLVAGGGSDTYWFKANSIGPLFDTTARPLTHTAGSLWGYQSLQAVNLDGDHHPDGPGPAPNTDLLMMSATGRLLWAAFDEKGWGRVQEHGGVLTRPDGLRGPDGREGPVVLMEGLPNLGGAGRYGLAVQTPTPGAVVARPVFTLALTGLVADTPEDYLKEGDMLGVSLGAAGGPAITTFHLFYDATDADCIFRSVPDVGAGSPCPGLPNQSGATAAVAGLTPGFHRLKVVGITATGHRATAYATVRVRAASRRQRQYVASYGVNGRLHLAAHQGDGFMSPAENVTLDVKALDGGEKTIAVQLFDADNDNDQDVLVASGAGAANGLRNQLRFFRNNGQAADGQPESFTTTWQAADELDYYLSNLSQTCAADFDGDGLLDVLVAGGDESPGTSAGGGGFTVLLNNPQSPGTFVMNGHTSGPIGQSDMTAIVCADMVSENGQPTADGKVDLLARWRPGAGSEPAGYIFPGRGDGTFVTSPIFGSEPHYLRLPSAGAFWTYQDDGLALARLTVQGAGDPQPGQPDAIPDLVLGGVGALRTARGYPASPPDQASATFGDTSALSPLALVSKVHQSIASVDMDHDGFEDVVSASCDGQLLWARADGAGGMTPRLDLGRGADGRQGGASLTEEGELSPLCDASGQPMGAYGQLAAGSQRGVSVNTNTADRLLPVPTAAFSVDRTKAEVNQPFTLTDVSTAHANAPLDRIEVYQNIFAPECLNLITAAANCPPSATGAPGGVIQLNYSKPGVYWIKLVAVDQMGYRASAYQQVTATVPAAVKKEFLGVLDDQGQLRLVNVQRGAAPVFSDLTDIDLGPAVQGAGNTLALAVADFDNDEDLDVLFAGGELLQPYPPLRNQLHLLLNDSPANQSLDIPANRLYFPVAPNLSAYLSTTGQACVADFNHDGYLDALVAGYNQSPGITSQPAYATLLINRPGAPATFDVSQHILGGLQYGASAVSCRDVTGDGLVDVLVTPESVSNGQYTPFLYPGQEDTPFVTFSFPGPIQAPSLSLLGGNGTLGVLTRVDTAADPAGRVDLVMGGINQLDWAPGDGTGNFGAAQPLFSLNLPPLPAGYDRQTASAMDANGLVAPGEDLFIATESGQVVFVPKREGADGFDDTARQPVTDLTTLGIHLRAVSTPVFSVQPASLALEVFGDELLVTGEFCDNWASSVNYTTTVRNADTGAPVANALVRVSYAAGAPAGSTLTVNGDSVTAPGQILSANANAAGEITFTLTGASAGGTISVLLNSQDNAVVPPAVGTLTYVVTLRRGAASLNITPGSVNLEVCPSSQAACLSSNPASGSIPSVSRASFGAAALNLAGGAIDAQCQLALRWQVQDPGGFGPLGAIRQDGTGSTFTSRGGWLGNPPVLTQHNTVEYRAGQRTYCDNTAENDKDDTLLLQAINQPALNGSALVTVNPAAFDHLAVVVDGVDPDSTQIGPANQPRPARAGFFRTATPAFVAASPTAPIYPVRVIARDVNLNQVCGLNGPLEVALSNYQYPEFTTTTPGTGEKWACANAPAFTNHKFNPRGDTPAILAASGQLSLLSSSPHYTQEHTGALIDTDIPGGVATHLALARQDPPLPSTEITPGGAQNLQNLTLVNGIKTLSYMPGRFTYGRRCMSGQFGPFRNTSMDVAEQDNGMDHDLFWSLNTQRSSTGGGDFVNFNVNGFRSYQQAPAIHAVLANPPATGNPVGYSPWLITTPRAPAYGIFMEHASNTTYNDQPNTAPPGYFSPASGNLNYNLDWAFEQPARVVNSLGAISHYIGRIPANDAPVANALSGEYIPAPASQQNTRIYAFDENYNLLAYSIEFSASVTTTNIQTGFVLQNILGNSAFNRLSGVGGVKPGYGGDWDLNVQFFDQSNNIFNQSNFQQPLRYRYAENPDLDPACTDNNGVNGTMDERGENYRVKWFGAPFANNNVPNQPASGQCILIDNDELDCTVQNPGQPIQLMYAIEWKDCRGIKVIYAPANVTATYPPGDKCQIQGNQQCSTGVADYNYSNGPRLGAYSWFQSSGATNVVALGDATGGGAGFATSTFLVEPSPDLSDPTDPVHPFLAKALILNQVQPIPVANPASFGSITVPASFPPSNPLVITFAKIGASGSSTLVRVFSPFGGGNEALAELRLQMVENVDYACPGDICTLTIPNATFNAWGSGVYRVLVLDAGGRGQRNGYAQMKTINK